MPRQSQIGAPRALHHIIIRGIERRMIFRDDEDQESFLDRLGGILLERATPCYSWSLPGNHGHFLFRTGDDPIAHVIKNVPYWAQRAYQAILSGSFFHKV